MTTVLDDIKQSVKLYNDYVKAGDSNAAVRIGKSIIESAAKECASPALPEPHRNYYIKTIEIIKNYIDNVAKGGTPKPISNGGNKSEDKIKGTDWFSADVPKVTMKDVAGLKNVQDEFLVNVFAPLSNKYKPIYDKYRKEMGLQILLYGPPGTGKTHIVKCLAGSLGCKIAVVQIKDVMANLVGDGAKIISEIFEQAKKYDRCIIFFDEIDAIAANREDDESRHTKEQLTTLLTNMDGFTAGTKPGQIRIIVAATNRPWILDSAVKRGGRFDTQIYVPLPDFEARKKLVALAFGKDTSVANRLDIPCAADVTVDWLAEKFEGYAGADIKAASRQMINRPMKREIESVRDRDVRINDCVTREDCEEVLSKYINSISDDMLFEFDAYAANMTLKEYMPLFEATARTARDNGENLDKHVLRWLAKIDRNEIILSLEVFEDKMREYRYSSEFDSQKAMYLLSNEANKIRAMLDKNGVSTTEFEQEIAKKIQEIHDLITK